MYFLNYKQLAEDLRDCKVSEKQKFNYLITSFIFLNFDVICRSINGLLWETFSEYWQKIIIDSWTPMNFIVEGVFFIIMGIMLFALYIINQRGDGKNFIERIACLYLPISIRITILGTIWGLLILSIGYICFSISVTDKLWDYVGIPLEMIVLVYGFVLLAKSLTIASTPKK